METNPQQPTANSYDTAVSVIGAVFGTLHFVFQTAADLTAHAEGQLVEKVTKGAITAADATQHRKDQTLIQQDKALQAIESYKAKMKAMAQKQNEPSTIQLQATGS